MALFHTTLRKKKAFAKAYQIQWIINDRVSLQGGKRKAISIKPLKNRLLKSLTASILFKK